MTQRRFRAGEVLGRSLAIWGRGAHAWIFLALLGNLPVLALAVWFLAGKSPPSPKSYIAFYFGNAFLEQVLTGALVYGVVQKLRNRPVGLARCIGVALRRLFPLFAVAAVVVLVTALPWGVRVLFDSGALAYWAWHLAILGVLAMFWVAVPAAVVERLGPAAALHRSLVLTRGYRARIFGILLVFMAARWAGGRLAVLIMESALERALDEGFDFAASLQMYFIVMILIALLLSSVRGVTMAVGYARLREAKEGMTVEDLARVFD